MLAVLMTLGSTRAAVVSDLSCTGVRLSGDDLPPRGELLEIKMSDVEAFGTVVWATDSQCGIAFETELASADVDALRLKAGKTCLSNMSVAEQIALDEWVLGVSR